MACLLCARDGRAAIQPRDEYGSSEAPMIAASLTALVVGSVFVFGGTSGIVLGCLYPSRATDPRRSGSAVAAIWAGEGAKNDESLLPQRRPPPEKGCLWRQATRVRRCIAWLHQRAFQALVAAPEPR